MRNCWIHPEIGLMHFASAAAEVVFALCCRSTVLLCGTGAAWTLVSSAVWDAFGFPAGPAASLENPGSPVDPASGPSAQYASLVYPGASQLLRLLFRQWNQGLSEAAAQQRSLTGRKCSFAPEISSNTWTWSCDRCFTVLLKHLRLNTGDL